MYVVFSLRISFLTLILQMISVLKVKDQSQSDQVKLAD